jgi:hypothetical protein
LNLRLLDDRRAGQSELSLHSFRTSALLIAAAI